MRCAKCKHELSGKAISTPCGHLCCNPCIKTGIENSSSATEFRCPHPACGTFIKLFTLDKAGIPAKYRDHMLPTLRTVHVDSDEKTLQDLQSRLRAAEGQGKQYKEDCSRLTRQVESVIRNASKAEDLLKQEKESTAQLQQQLNQLAAILYACQADRQTSTAAYEGLKAQFAQEKADHQTANYNLQRSQKQLSQYQEKAGVDAQELQKRVEAWERYYHFQASQANGDAVGSSILDLHSQFAQEKAHHIVSRCTWELDMAAREREVEDLRAKLEQERKDHQETKAALKNWECKNTQLQAGYPDVVSARDATVAFMMGGTEQDDGLADTTLVDISTEEMQMSGLGIKLVKAETETDWSLLRGPMGQRDDSSNISVSRTANQKPVGSRACSKVLETRPVPQHSHTVTSSTSILDGSEAKVNPNRVVANNLRPKSPVATQVKACIGNMRHNWYKRGSNQYRRQYRCQSCSTFVKEEPIEGLWTTV